MPMCQVRGCTNRTGSVTPEGEKRSFFSIPNPKKKEELCGKWLHSIGSLKFKLRTYTYSPNRVVCQDHFTPDCFEVNKQAKMLGYKPFRKQLKTDAVPNINVNLPKKKDTVKRVSTSLAKRSAQTELQTGSKKVRSRGRKPVTLELFPIKITKVSSEPPIKKGIDRVSMKHIAPEEFEGDNGVTFTIEPEGLEDENIGCEDGDDSWIVEEKDQLLEEEPVECYEIIINP